MPYTNYKLIKHMNYSINYKPNVKYTDEQNNE